MRTALQVVAALSAGLLTQLISAPVTLPGNAEAWLHWVVFVPLFWALDKDTPRKNIWLSYLTGTALIFTNFFWITESILRFSNLPPVLAYLCLLLFSMGFGLTYPIVFSQVHPMRERFGKWWVLLIPALQVVLEFGAPALFPYYQGVTQYRTPWTYQLASVTGITGVTFLIMATNAALAELIYSRREGARPPWGMVGAVAGLFVANLVFGAVRYSAVQKEIATWPTIQVAQIQQSTTMETVMSESPRTSMLRWYRQTNQLVGQDMDLAVWPEGATPYDPRGGRVGELMGTLAQNLEAPILFGGGFAEKKTDPETGRRFVEQRNSIYLVSPEGELVERYDKMVPLPFGEYLPGADTFPILKEWIKGPGDVEAGTVPLVFEVETDAGLIEFTTPICYEAILAPFVRKNLGEGQLFVNVTNDGWFGDTAAPHQHAMLSAVRSMELGIPNFRSAYTGVSMVILPSGDILHETEAFTDVTRVIEVPVGRIRTIHSRIGALFDWLCVLAILGAIGLVARDAWAQRRAVTPAPPQA